MASRLLPLADAKNDRNRALKRPAGRLSVEGLVFGLRNSRSAILRGISFRLDAGEVLGIIGPSGAGKSTLARQIIDVLAPSAGAVRLDGADVSTWPRELLGRVLGYLPQDIELFAGTVAALAGPNARFRVHAEIHAHRSRKNIIAAGPAPPSLL